MTDAANSIPIVHANSMNMLVSEDEYINTGSSLEQNAVYKQ